jgi:hydroxymethylglutaryl-CoA reductase
MLRTAKRLLHDLCTSASTSDASGMNMWPEAMNHCVNLVVENHNNLMYGMHSKVATDDYIR